MRFGLVEAHWAVEGCLVRLVSRLAIYSGCLLAGAAIVGAGWWLAASVVADREVGAVGKRWAEIGRPFGDFIERYPHRDVNESAVRLEQLAGPLGIDLVTKTVTDRDRPDEATVEEFESVSDAFKSYSGMIARSNRMISALPDPDAVAYLEHHDDTLTAIVDHLLSEEIPQWEMDIARAFEAPLPNLLGQIHLARVLVAWSVLLDRSDRFEDARQVVEAAWAFHLSSARRPELLAQLIGLVEANSIAGAMRNQRRPASHWAELLLSHDAMGALLDAIEGEAWMSLEGTRLGQIVESDNVLQRAAMPALKRGTAIKAEAMRRAVASLPVRRFAGFDAGEGFSVTLESVAPKSIVGRIAIPDVWDSWARAGRSMLCRELSAQAISTRSEAGAGEAGATDLFLEQPSAVFPSVSWRRVEDDGGVLIEPVEQLPALPPLAMNSMCSSWREERTRGR